MQIAHQQTDEMTQNSSILDQLELFARKLDKTPLLQEAARDILCFARHVNARRDKKGTVLIESTRKEAHRYTRGFAYLDLLMQHANQYGQFELTAFLSGLHRLALFCDYPVPEGTAAHPDSASKQLRVTQSSLHCTGSHW